jgi:type IV pilus assembly protein PilM
MDLPWMESEDFASALKFQVHDALPVDVRTVEVGYHLLEELGTSALGLPETNRILVVATSSEGVAATASVLRQAGLHPVAADTHAFGLIRAACSASADADAAAAGSTELLVDIGAQQLTMIIHQDGTPLLIRSVSHVAGEAAITTIADDLDIDAAQAEAEMVSTGINGPAPILTPISESSVFASSVTATLPRTDPRTERITEVLGRWATTVVKEIQDSLDYYSSTSPETPVSRIRLMGRTSRLRGLSERITTQTLLPVVTMDSLAGLPAHGPATRAIPEDQRFALAIGLAL